MGGLMIGSEENSEVLITVNSQIKSFIDYEPLNNVFVVNGTLTETEDVGNWTVRVKIVYYEDNSIDQSTTLPTDTANENETSVTVAVRIKQVYQQRFYLQILENTENQRKNDTDLESTSGGVPSEDDEGIEKIEKIGILQEQEDIVIFTD